MVLTAALGPLCLQIHHVGSTSIPGMIAKPVLDIDIELAPRVSLAQANQVLEPLGYIFKGDQGIPERYAYDRKSPEVPYSSLQRTWMTHHLYVCPHGSVELARHLKFRDLLRQHADLHEAYCQLKRDVLKIADGDRQVYVDQKAILGQPFFDQVLNR